MDVILANNSAYYLNLKFLARLPHQLSNSQRYISNKYLVPIFRHTNKMILNIENCVTSISVFNRHLQTFGGIILDLFGMINLPA